MNPLEALGFGPFFETRFKLLNRPDFVPARIAADGRGSFPLLGCSAPLGELSGRLRHQLGPLERPVVGDWVAIADGAERALIHHVLERRTAMIRRAAGTAGGGQVVAANVDLFMIVTSADRDFNPRRLERYLTAVWDSGAAPVIVLNKIDLGGIDAILREIDSVALGAPVVQVSARTGDGLEALRARLGRETTVALVGSSGVGKSSLINRLLGGEVQRTLSLRSDGRGRHATTRRELIELSGGGILIDTPGMRELGLIEDAGGVDAGFADVAALAERCRYRDCGHQGEPGCVVEAAVKAGELDAARLAGYLKLRKEIAAAERRRDPALAGRDKRRWKSIHKSMRARSKVDPKFKR
jgi:ribosome biogenesis GTPase